MVEDADRRIVDKVKNPVGEIRNRAIRNIISKADMGLLDLGAAARQTPLCQNILAFVLEEAKICARGGDDGRAEAEAQQEDHKSRNPAYELIRKILFAPSMQGGHEEGRAVDEMRRIFRDCGAKHLLEEAEEVASGLPANLHRQSLVVEIRKIKSLLDIQGENASTTARSTTFGNEWSRNSNSSDTTATFSGGLESPAHFLNHSRRKAETSSLPHHLLLKRVAVDKGSDRRGNISTNSSSSLNSSSKGRSPVTRSYFKQRKSVTFSLDDDTTENGPDLTAASPCSSTSSTLLTCTTISKDCEEDMIHSHYPGQMLLEKICWHSLTSRDRQHLDSLKGLLEKKCTKSDRGSIEAALMQFHSVTLEDFPPEMFLQRSELLIRLQRLLELSPDPHLRHLSCACLSKLTCKLQKRLRALVSDPGVHSASTDTIGDVPPTSSNNSDHTFGIAGSGDDDDDQEYLNDVIESRRFRSNQIRAHDLCLNLMAVTAEILSGVFQDKTVEVDDDDEEKPPEEAFLAVEVTSLFRNSLALLCLLESGPSLEKSHHIRPSDSKESANPLLCRVRERLLDIASVLTKKFHRTGTTLMSTARTKLERTADLMLLACAKTFWEKFARLLGSDQRVGALSSALEKWITDQTLYVTNRHLHTKLMALFRQKDGSSIKEFSDARTLMKSLADFIQLKEAIFTKGNATPHEDQQQKSQKQRNVMELCDSALDSLQWHQNAEVLRAAIRRCLLENKHENMDKLSRLIVKSFTLVNEKDDIRKKVKTMGVFELHKIVQESLGAFAAANEPSRKRRNRLDFLIECPEVSRQIYNSLGDMSYNSGAGMTIGDACHEMVLYLLKRAPETLGPDWFAKYVRNCLSPNMDAMSAAAGSRSKVLLDTLLNPEVEATGTAPILSELEILRSNIRLLFHGDEETRIKSESNIKFMLAKEPQSFERLPKFSSIIQTDLQSHFYQKFVDSDHFIVIRRNDDPSQGGGSLHDDEVTAHLLTICHILRESGVMAPSASIKEALVNLELAMESPEAQSRMLQPFLSTGRTASVSTGLEAVLSLIDLTLSEMDDSYRPEDLMPPALSILKQLVLGQQDVRRRLGANRTLLFSLVRSAFIAFHHNCGGEAVGRDVAVLLFLLVTSDRSVAIDHKCGQIVVDQVVALRFKVPFVHRVEEDKATDKGWADLTDQATSLIKTFWNVAHQPAVCRWDSDPPFQSKVVDNNKSCSISNRLDLTPRELAILQASDPRHLFHSNLRKALSSNNHAGFLHHLKLAEMAVHLAGNESELTWDPKECCQDEKTTAWWQKFESFFTKSPRSSKDLFLYRSIVAFFGELTGRKDAENGSDRGLVPFLRSVLKSGASVFLKILDFDDNATTIPHNEGTPRSYDPVLQGFAADAVVDFLTRCRLRNIPVATTNGGAVPEGYLASLFNLNLNVWSLTVMEKSLCLGEIDSVLISGLLEKLASALIITSSDGSPLTVKARGFTGSTFRLKVLMVISKLLRCSTDATIQWLLNQRELRLHGEKSFIGALFEWMLQSRRPSIRFAAMNIILQLARVTPGTVAANGLENAGRPDQSQTWEVLAQTALCKEECYHIRQKAFEAMRALLRASKESAAAAASWFGPIFVEPISRMTVDGEAALQDFLSKTGMSDGMCDLLKAFSSFHHRTSATCEDNLDSFEDAVVSAARPPAAPSLPPPTVKLVTEVLMLIQTVLQMEDEVEGGGVVFEGSSILPGFEEVVNPSLVDLCFDASSDPRRLKSWSSSSVLTRWRLPSSDRTSADGRNGEESNDKDSSALRDYVAFFANLCKVLSCCLSETGRTKRSSSAFRTAALLWDNGASCQSMLTSSVYELFKAATRDQSFPRERLGNLVANFCWESAECMRVLAAGSRLEQNLTEDPSEIAAMQLAGVAAQKMVRRYFYPYCRLLSFLLDNSCDKVKGEENRHQEWLVAAATLTTNLFDSSVFPGEAILSEGRAFATLKELIEKLIRAQAMTSRSYDAKDRRWQPRKLLRFAAQKVLVATLENARLVPGFPLTMIGEGALVKESVLDLARDEVESYLDRQVAGSGQLQSSTTLDKALGELRSLYSFLTNLVLASCPLSKQDHASTMLAPTYEVLDWCIDAAPQINVGSNRRLVDDLIRRTLEYLTALASGSQSVQKQLTATLEAPRRRLNVYQLQQVRSSRVAIRRQRPAKDKQRLLPLLLELGKSAAAGSVRPTTRVSADSSSPELALKFETLQVLFGLLMTNLSNRECRAFVLRDKLLDHGAAFLEDSRQLAHGKPTTACTRTAVTARQAEILWLDLMLTLTSYSDGQVWAGHHPRLAETLVEIAGGGTAKWGTTSLRRQGGPPEETSTAPLAALAILRNMTFNPANRAKLLLSKNFVRVLSLAAANGGGDEGSFCDKDNQSALFALTAIWALAANNHKAKVTLAQSGLTRSLKSQLDLRIYNRFKSSSRKPDAEIRPEKDPPDLDDDQHDKENVSLMSGTELLRQVVSLLEV